MANDRTRATIDALYAAYNDHDGARVEALYAPGATHEEIAQGRAAEGAPAIRSGLERFFDSFPDARWEPERFVMGGLSVAVPYRMTGTLHQQLGPFPPAGQALDLRGVHVFEIDDAGRIAHSADYWDAGTFGRQMKV